MRSKCFPDDGWNNKIKGHSLKDKFVWIRTVFEMYLDVSIKFTFSCERTKWKNHILRKQTTRVGF